MDKVIKAVFVLLIPVAVYLGYQMGNGGVSSREVARESASSKTQVSAFSENGDSERRTYPVSVNLEEWDTAIAGSNGQLARIQLNSPESLEAALLRAEELFNKGRVTPADQALAFVLHGPEVAIFLKQNYSENKRIVDLAAKLSAFNVVDVKVCETRVGVLGADKESLPAFIDTVPYGPTEVTRLLEDEQYVYF